MNPLILLFVAVCAAAQTATIKHELNSIDAKSDLKRIEYHSTNPSLLESTTGKSLQEDVHFANLKKQTNKQDSFHDTKTPVISEPPFMTQSPAKSSQLQNSGIKSEQGLFHSENLGPNAAHVFPQVSEHRTFSGFPQRQRQQPQFYGQEQDMPNRGQFSDEHDQQKSLMMSNKMAQEEQFRNDQQQRDIEQQQFFSNNQELIGRQQYYGMPEQQYFNDMQQPKPAQPQYSGNQSPIQYSGDNQASMNQQQYSGDNQAPMQPQQQFYSNIQMGMNDQGSGKSFQAMSQMKNQMYSGKQLAAFQTSGMQGNVRLSAFNNREQPIMLPGGPALHSSSFVVSGLSNLPMLPAMVYNTGSMPAAHAVAVSKGTMYRGSVRQHLRTPYVRYVYSHLL